MCFKPTTWPPNFDDGPQIFVCVTFFEKPFRIFSATSATVAPGRMRIGFDDFGFEGSFVKIRKIFALSNIFSFRYLSASGFWFSKKTKS